jgi:hypothetical protein
VSRVVLEFAWESLTTQPTRTNICFDSLGGLPTERSLYARGTRLYESLLLLQEVLSRGSRVVFEFGWESMTTEPTRSHLSLAQ